MTRRVLWVGCGRHAEQMLLPQLVRQDVEIVAFCDVNEAAAVALARRYGVPRVDLDFRHAIETMDVDVVGVAAGPAVHRDVALAALARGRHVFMEKPCGATVDDARKIAEAAKAAGRTVGIGFMKRFATVNRIARNVLDRPDFGPVAGVFGEYMTAPGYFKAGRGCGLHQLLSAPLRPLHGPDAVARRQCGDKRDGVPHRAVTRKAVAARALRLRVRRHRHAGHGHVAVARHADGAAAGDGRPSPRRGRWRQRGQLLPQSAVQGRRPRRHARR